jgi:hypothetical protein
MLTAELAIHTIKEEVLLLMCLPEGVLQLLCNLIVSFLAGKPEFDFHLQGTQGKLAAI